MDQGAIAVSLIASSLILNVPVGSAECGLREIDERFFVGAVAPAPTKKCV
jgi:hypothetical protein